MTLLRQSKISLIRTNAKFGVASQDDVKALLSHITALDRRIAELECDGPTWLKFAVQKLHDIADEYRDDFVGAELQLLLQRAGLERKPAPQRPADTADAERDALRAKHTCIREFDPDLTDRLISEARAGRTEEQWGEWLAANAPDMADQLEAARMELERLRADSKVAWEQVDILADGLEQACSALVSDRGADVLRAKLRKLYRDAYRAAKGCCACNTGVPYPAVEQPPDHPKRRT